MHGQIASVVILRDPVDPARLRNYCFVHYEERASALRAAEELEANKPELEGKALQVRGLGGACDEGCRLEGVNAA